MISEKLTLKDIILVFFMVAVTGLALSGSGRQVQNFAGHWIEDVTYTGGTNELE